MCDMNSIKWIQNKVLIRLSWVICSTNQQAWLDLSTIESSVWLSLSLPKSEICCCRNFSQTLQNSITNYLGVHAILFTSKYLGLPSRLRRISQELLALSKIEFGRKKF